MLRLLEKAQTAREIEAYTRPKPTGSHNTQRCRSERICPATARSTARGANTDISGVTRRTSTDLPPWKAAC